jgi:hypothetical protein
VPFIGPRSRYNVLGVSPTWIYQDMDSAVFSHKKPAAGGEPVDPAVVGGKAEYLVLDEGGIFSMVADRKKATEVLEVDLGGATLEIHDWNTILAELGGGSASVAVRSTPTAPFLMGSSEVLVAIGDAGGRVGILIKEQGDKIL